MSQPVHPVKEDEKGKVEDALNTLVKAAEIAQDEELMSKVKTLAGGKKQAIKSIADLIARRESLHGKKMMEDSSCMDDEEGEASEEASEA